MNLSGDKYRPKTAEEWVGDAQVLLDLEECIKNNIPVVLVGPPGVGKTSAVYLISEKLGYNVIETNASDERRKEELKDLKTCLTSKTFGKNVFLLDEVDGIDNQEMLMSAVSRSVQPVAMTANDGFRLSSKIKKGCKVIEVSLKPSQLGLVVKRMKQIAEAEKREVSLQGVTTDVRESINKVFMNSEGYTKEENNFEKVNNVFKRGQIEDVPIIWLIDNAFEFYHGRDFFQALQTLVLYSRTGEKRLLSCLPRARRGRPTYPYYLKKARVNNDKSNR